MTEEAKRIVEAIRAVASENDDTLTTTDVHDLYDAVEAGRDWLYKAAELIEQLSAELEQAERKRDETIDYTGNLIKRLSQQYEKVKRERDAAVHDLREQSACAHCKHYRETVCITECLFISGSKTGWQWRGPCAENGGVEK